MTFSQLTSLSMMWTDTQYIGIDASIWYHHAMFSKKGESPELRFLFFRLCKLTRLPFIPLFVFDGRERPEVKRGSRMGKAGSHALTAGFKKLLELFGMEWRMVRLLLSSHNHVSPCLCRLWEMPKPNWRG